MTPPSGFSAQTLPVLAARFAQPVRWQHGYALAKQAGRKSGSLSPILIRLDDRYGPDDGRPRRGRGEVS